MRLLPTLTTFVVLASFAALAYAGYNQGLEQTAYRIGSSVRCLVMGFKGEPFESKCSSANSS
jgi:hypothetical protein